MSRYGIRERTLALILALSPVAVAIGQERVVDDAEKVGENLNLRFANGIVAIAESKVITVDDLKREILPVIPQLRREVRSEQEFEIKLQQLQDEVLQDLIDRVLIVKEFYKDEKRRVPASIIDNAVAETVINEFDGDRSKFLAYLRSRGMSQKEYRRDTEERIIYDYMRQQQRKSTSTVSPVRIQEFYDENKDRFVQEDSVHLRLIQINRNPGDTDDSLRRRAAEVVARLDSGEPFAEVAQAHSQESRRSKGGDWGWQRKNDLRKEFSDAVFALEKGEYTDPILTPEGAFILYVEDRKFAGILPIDEVRVQIERILLQQNTRQAQERWLERLRRNAYVKHF